MPFSCILPDKLEEYRKAIKDRKLDLVEMMKMSTEDRTAEFEKFAGKEGAKQLNRLFEEKLILKNRIQGLKNFVNKSAQLGKYSPMGKAEIEREISEYRSKQQERIFSPKEHEAYLGGLVEKMLGVHIPKEVAAKVFELSAKADKEKVNNPKLSGVSDEYFKAKQELNQYVESQKPQKPAESILKNLIVIGRNNMLLNPSTPIKATTGQAINSTMDFVSRRLASGKFQGANSDLADQANKEAWETFQKTGVNTASMESMDDVHTLNKGENFRAAEGATGAHGALAKTAEVVSKAAKISNKVAIDWEHNISFTKFYQKAFFDMLNLHSTNIAEFEGKEGDEVKTRAAEIFKDACRIEPETQEGDMLRLEAQKQAARITSTNDTWASRISLGIKNALNKAGRGLPLGDLIIPIAKIPSNIVANGIENAGGGIYSGITDIFEGRKKIQSDDLETRYKGLAQFHNGIQRMMRIGGSIGTAFLIASQFKKDDFRTDKFDNHFVKIGNTWINTEYISAISPALAGAMAVRGMKDKGIEEAVLHYVRGSLEDLEKIPGADELTKLFHTMKSPHLAYAVKKYMSDFFNSRGEPAFIKNLLNNRPINHLFFGAQGVESTDDVRQDKVEQKERSRERKKEMNR